jgi:hypothetical protein
LSAIINRPTSPIDCYYTLYIAGLPSKLSLALSLRTYSCAGISAESKQFRRR